MQSIGLLKDYANHQFNNDNRAKKFIDSWKVLLDARKRSALKKNIDMITIELLHMYFKDNVRNTMKKNKPSMTVYSVVIMLL